MTRRRALVGHLMGPYAALAFLLLGLAIGTWLPSVGAPFAAAVRLLVRGLVLAAPVIILVTVLPSLLSLFAVGAGRAPIVVLGLFTATTVVAGTYALLVAWPIYGLDAGGGSGAGFADALGAIGPLFGNSRPVFALLWAFGSAVVLHGLMVLGRRVGTPRSATGRAIAGSAYAARATAGVFAWIGSHGVAVVGRGLSRILPFLLFAVGTFVPAAVADAAGRAGEAGGTDALRTYLVAAALVGAITATYLVLVAVVATRVARTSLRRALGVYAPPVYAFAWATASSTATIPLNIQSAREGLAVQEATTEFVIPLGATVNLDGTMIAAVLITPIAAAAVGVDVTLGQLAATLVPLLVLTAGAPGLPAGISIIAPPVIASVLGLQGATAAAFVGVWFAFSVGLSDQFRSAANSVNNGLLCLIVERLLTPRQRILLEEIPAGALAPEPAGAGAL